MRIANLRLSDFRNFNNLEQGDFGDINVLFGANAQGKTNFLEAMFLLATGRGARGQHDDLMASHGKDGYFVAARVEQKYGPVDLAMEWRKATGKQARVNGIPQTRLADFVGRLTAVMLQPRDIELVYGSPSIRRRFLDVHISQMSPRYLRELQIYQRLLLNRNTALKQRRPDPDLISVYDEQMVRSATVIISERREFLAGLDAIARDRHAKLTGELENVNLRYQCCVNPEENSDSSISSLLRARIESARQRDIEQQVSTVGPHREDWQMYINGTKASEFASQGQQKSALISVMVAAFDVISRFRGDYPVLLLDDIWSELDESRRKAIIDLLPPGTQCFITGTDFPAMTGRLREGKTHVFEVKAGILTRSL
jgi:DNA replication and repair protein RecF